MHRASKQKIAQLDCWQSSVKIDPLSNNRAHSSYRVSDDDDSYVVRLISDDPLQLTSWVNERATCDAAFEAGLSPELIYSEPGVLVVRWIEGQVFQPADVRNDQQLARITTRLKDFHHAILQTFQGIPVMFWVFQHLRHYQTLLRQGGSQHRNRLIELDDQSALLKKAVGKIEIVFGHNNLQASSFIDDGETIWLIDLGHACFNSPLFDLSSLASNNELSTDQEITLLETYFGSWMNLKQ